MEPSKKHLPIFLTFFGLALAIIMNNSQMHGLYQSMHQLKVGLVVGDMVFKKELYHWVNEGLMAIFFFAMTLEIRKELFFGHLNSIKSAAAPVVAALGGVMVPVSVYFLFCGHDPVFLQGWAIPAATDIIFALFVFDLVVKEAPGLKFLLRLFLLSIAVVDDVIGVAIIALFYSKELSSYYLLMTASFMLMMAFFRYIQLAHRTVYAFFGLVLWVSILYSGVHATMAGVILACFMPFSSKDEMVHLEHHLEPLMMYCIVPLFAFFNAGIFFTGLDFFSLHPVLMGVFIGLWLGKPLGIVGMTWLFHRFHWIDLPKGMRFDQLILIGLLAGIGFTVSLFIGSLSFDESTDVDEYMKLGIIYGSAMSIISAVLWAQFRKRYAN
ncbi:Na+/H+ antiporter NhaA [Gammaproteobacteria bacterium]|nr:Na+/H+ antiporter NhaA [Gammaproteobacteria bacterium]